MTDQLLHDEPYGALWLAPEVPCIIIQWKGFANQQQFQSIMDRGLELYRAHARHHQPLGWLADCRNLSAINNTVQEWLNRDWNCRAAALGIQHVSFVVSESVFGKITVQNYSQKTERTNLYTIQTAHHATSEQARHWLHQQLQQLSANQAV